MIKVPGKEQDGKARTYTADRDYSISLKIRIPAKDLSGISLNKEHL